MSNSTFDYRSRSVPVHICDYLKPICRYIQNHGDPHVTFSTQSSNDQKDYNKIVISDKLSSLEWVFTKNKQLQLPDNVFKYESNTVPSQSFLAKRRPAEDMRKLNELQHVAQQVRAVFCPKPGDEKVAEMEQSVNCDRMFPFLTLQTDSSSILFLMPDANGTVASMWSLLSASFFDAILLQLLEYFECLQTTGLCFPELKWNDVWIKTESLRTKGSSVFDELTSSSSDRKQSLFGDDEDKDNDLNLNLTYLFITCETFEKVTIPYSNHVWKLLYKLFCDSTKPLPNTVTVNNMKTINDKIQNKFQTTGGGRSGWDEEDYQAKALAEQQNSSHVANQGILPLPLMKEQVFKTWNHTANFSE